jgi:hypothetical protein
MGLPASWNSHASTRRAGRPELPVFRTDAMEAHWTGLMTSAAKAARLRPRQPGPDEGRQHLMAATPHIGR